MTAYDGRANLLQTRREKAAGLVLTLAKEGVFREIPQGRLDHLKVTASEAVHECWKEISRDAESVKNIFM